MNQEREALIRRGLAMQAGVEQSRTGGLPTAQAGQPVQQGMSFTPNEVFAQIGVLTLEAKKWQAMYEELLMENLKLRNENIDLTVLLDQAKQELEAAKGDASNEEREAPTESAANE